MLYTWLLWRVGKCMIDCQTNGPTTLDVGRSSPPNNKYVSIDSNWFRRNESLCSTQQFLLQYLTLRFYFRAIHSEMITLMIIICVFIVILCASIIQCNKNALRVEKSQKLLQFERKKSKLIDLIGRTIRTRSVQMNDIWWQRSKRLSS